MSGDLIGIKISQLQSYSGDAPSNAKVPMSVDGETFAFEGLSLLAKKSSVYTKSEVNSLINPKANKSDVYTIEQVDSLIEDFVVSDSVYSKGQVDSLLSVKANTNTTYTKTEVDNLVVSKVDAGDVYLKGVVDSMLSEKADADNVYSISEINSLLSDKVSASYTYSKSETDALLSNKQGTIDLSGGNQILFSANGSLISKIGIKDRGLDFLTGGDYAWGYTESGQGEYNCIWVGDNIPSGSKSELHSWGIRHNTSSGFTDLKFNQLSSNGEINLPASGDLLTLNELNSTSGDLRVLINSLTPDLNSFILNVSGEPTSFELNESKRGLLETSFIDLNYSESYFDGNPIKGLVVGDINGLEGSPYGSMLTSNGLAIFSENNSQLNRLRIKQEDIDIADGEREWFLPTQDGYLASQSELNSGLDTKANTSTTYTKTEVDILLSGKPDASSFYTKSESDTLLSGKADKVSVYTKSESDSLLNNKANQSTTYTKTEVDNLLPTGATTSSSGIVQLASNSSAQSGVGNNVLTSSSAAATYVPIAGTPATGDVGELLSAERTSSNGVDVVANVWTEVVSLTVPAGTYIISAMLTNVCTAASSGTPALNNIALHISTGALNNGFLTDRRFMGNTSNTFTEVIGGTSVINISSTTTFRAMTRAQFANYSIDSYGIIKAYRLRKGSF